MRKSSLLLGLLLGLGSLSAHAGLLFPTPVASAPISGKTVDSSTGKPLAGVLVVATWHDFTPDYSLTFHQGGGGVYSCRQLVNVLTAVSDAEGNYKLPAWSGKFSHCQHMSLGQPWLVFYKPGYSAADAGNDVPFGKEYDAGPDYTKSEWDGYTFQLHPLGPQHYKYNGQDNQVSKLIEYAGIVTRAFGNDRKGLCFWDEERPVILLLLQEQRRLSGYLPPHFDILTTFYGQPVTDERCIPAGAMSTLSQEAQATPVDSPPEGALFGQMVRPWGGRVGATPHVPETKEVFVPPKYFNDYMAEDARSDAMHAVVYHVDLDPANPYYVAMLRDDIPRQEVLGPSDDPFGIPDSRDFIQDGIKGFSCPYAGWIGFPEGGEEIWRIVPPSSTPDLYVRGRPLPSSPDVRTAQIDPPASIRGFVLDLVQPRSIDWHDVCYWAVELVPPFGSGHQRLPWEHQSFFDTVTGIWTLNEHSFVRLLEGSLPGVVEIHGTTSLHVSTELTPAGQDRWLLPPPGQPFSLSIEPVPNTFVAETKSAYAQKLSGVVTAALAKGERPFTKVQNLDGAKFVWYVFEKAGMGYPYATAHELRWSSLSFREEATPEDGDIAWWPDYVALVSMKPGEPMQFITAEAVIDDTVMETQRGKPRFYRRED